MYLKEINWMLKASGLDLDLIFIHPILRHEHCTVDVGKRVDRRTKLSNCHVSQVCKMREQRARVGSGSRGPCHCGQGRGRWEELFVLTSLWLRPHPGNGDLLNCMKDTRHCVGSFREIFRFTSIDPGLAFPSREWRFDSILNEINKLTEFDFMTCGLCFKRPCHTEVTWDFLLNLDNKLY